MNERIVTEVQISRGDARRLERQAKALAVVKAFRPKGHPEHADAIAARNRPLAHTDDPGTDPSAPGMVYFIYSAGFIKIGYTTDIKQRMADFHTHSPLPVTLLLTIRGWPEDEEHYHQEFQADRIRREWFRLSLHLREFLDCHFESGTFELMANAEDEARELFEQANTFWNQLQIEMGTDDMTNPDIGFELENARRDLIAKREAAGADTEIGHRCSNLIEQLEHYRTAEGEQRTNLAKSIKRTLAELAIRHQ